METKKVTKEDSVLRNSHRALLLDNLRKSVEDNCGLIFAFWHNREGEATVSYSFEEIWFEAGYVARDLILNKGLEKGDRIILSYEHGLEFFIAFLGCLRAGIIPVFVCTPLEDEYMDTNLFVRLSAIHMDCDAKLILVDLPTKNSLSSNGDIFHDDVGMPFHVHPKMPKDLTRNEKMRFTDDNIPSEPTNIDEHAFLQYSYIKKTEGEIHSKVVAVSFSELKANVENFIDWSLQKCYFEDKSLEKIKLFSWLLHDYKGLGKL